MNERDKIGRKSLNFPLGGSNKSQVRKNTMLITNGEASLTQNESLSLSMANNLIVQHKPQSQSSQQMEREKAMRNTNVATSNTLTPMTTAAKAAQNAMKLANTLN